MSENRILEVELWPLEDIERELQTIVNEAMHLPPLQAGERISACAKAALETLSKLLDRE